MGTARVVQEPKRGGARKARPPPAPAPSSAREKRTRGAPPQAVSDASDRRADLESASRSLLLKSVCAEAFWRAVVAVHLSGHFRPLACNKMTPTLYINHYFHLPTSSTSCMPTSTRSQRRCAPPCHTLSHRTAPHTLAQARTHAQHTHARTHA